jgi:hypothetical protein
VRSTATSSFRTLLASRGDRPPGLVKLSLGARVGGLPRALSESFLVTGIVVSRVLATIPEATRQVLRFEWFPESAGVVDRASGTGWILRQFPPLMSRPRAGPLLPVFSLIAPRGDQPPLLVDWIRRSGQAPETFVVEAVLRPYVTLLAHLLLEEGIQVQAHVQNVLVELNSAGEGIRRLVLRDLADTSVNVALRLAKRKPLPALDAGLLPGTTPFPVVRSVMDHAGSREGRRPAAASDTVEKYGLNAFVWAINTSLARYFRGYAAGAIQRCYLELWRDAAMALLRVEPIISRRPLGLATDEAIEYYLAHADWARAGVTPGVSLPKDAEPLPASQRFGRRAGPVYDRVESPWGELYLDRGRPVCHRPAF